MLQKFNITAYAVVLCLFGFVLVPAAPAWAGVSEDIVEYERCVNLKGMQKPKKSLKCFRALTKKMINEKKKICINRAIKHINLINLTAGGLFC